MFWGHVGAGDGRVVVIAVRHGEVDLRVFFAEENHVVDEHCYEGFGFRGYEGLALS